ncbi:cell wall hydrolase [Sphingomonas sp. GCM10030256]|uniref:cell wall hydrolase n=1 Tax=Sphingomonas sp. GCM10030256 TaxID=3273427 RepID=UPI003609B580
MTIAMTLSRPVEVRAALQWLRSHPQESLLGGLTAIAALAALGAVANPAGSTPRPLSAEERALAAVPPPTPLPTAVRNIAPSAAVQINAAVPIARGPNPPAMPFRMTTTGAAFKQAAECLAEGVYYEAATEPLEGQQAVAQVILNRVRHPAYPSSVCGVVYQGSERETGCQFTFTCDGSLARRAINPYWSRAYKVAAAALRGFVYAPVGNATHYHTNWVVPYWASTLTKNAVVGTHIFYRWRGTWGQPTAFGQRYAGREPDGAKLRQASLAAEASYRAKAGAAPTAVAGQMLPPELAALVELELKSGNTDGRVALTIPNPRQDGSKPIEPEIPRATPSANLDWTLTGNLAFATDQKPLGKPAAPETAAAPVAPATPSGQP